MKAKNKKWIVCCLMAGIVLTGKAQTGAPYIHDPSTIAECEGKYYTFGTGAGRGTVVLSALVAEQPLTC